MIIGNFKYDAKQDTYDGAITTFTGQRADLQLVPVETPVKRGPQYRLVAQTALGKVEFGSAWKRKSKAGADYISVEIDDPSLSRSINAALKTAQNSDNAILIWSRPNGSKAKKE